MKAPLYGKKVLPIALRPTSMAIISSLIFTISPIAIATPATPCSASDWRCHNSFYVTGGYVFTHGLQNKNVLSITPPGYKKIEFTPYSAYPNNTNGIRLGFGSGLGDHTPFGYELSYTQVFPKSKTTNDLIFTRSRKSFSTSINYTLNPDSRLRVNALFGASVASFYTTSATVSPLPTYTQTNNTVDVDPYIGGSVVYSINSKFVARLVEYFAFAEYNLNAKGAWLTLLMLNYYPGAV